MRLDKEEEEGYRRGGRRTRTRNRGKNWVEEGGRRWWNGEEKKG